MEREALNEYVQYQQNHGHPDLYATSSDVIVSLTHPFLAASPDANVYDPTSSDPFGFAEIKCPYKYRELAPEEAATNSDFMLRKAPDGRLCLKNNHIYVSHKYRDRWQLAVIIGVISLYIQVKELMFRE